ncbi:alpha/beta-hydrolase [Ophiobolus disseminans]|uniref:Alpha/beta-hydrolase n=1 Tax=Ophiobolus disseminans TaxID=1469910 RepID=A0A6A6ZR64_9PLEO|nr:alpha/beta-hydrolase [Ophiobolus disseminans]
MPALQSIFIKAYWALAGVGILWAVAIGSLLIPTVQRNALYAHKISTNFWHNVSNPEEFGFAKGQVQPFWLDTSDGERLFCYHVLPLDVYLEHESELVQAVTTGEVVDELESTVGAKLLKRDAESRVVVNFHGNAGHIAQGYRPSTYRSISGIPHTHLLTCDYRGFGLSSLNNPPHIPTEKGIITDAISLLSYIQTSLHHPPSRTVLLGQSLGTAITAASALYFADPSSTELPTNLTHPIPRPASPSTFASIILVAPFRDLPTLLQTYAIAGLIPILKPLRGYPRISKFLATKILDHWRTLPRLSALIRTTSTTKSRVHIHILHARNDADISFRESEGLYQPLQSVMLGEEGASATEERRSIHGGERVKRGAFAYKKVEDAGGRRVVELEVVRYGGHNEVVGWTQVALAVRRGFERGRRVGVDEE